jgi:two-component system, OmpR family, sensor histidine kinase CpxA
MSAKNFIKANFFWKILFWFWGSFALIFIVCLFILQLNNDSIRYQKTPEHLSQQVESSRARVMGYLAKNSNHLKRANANWKNVYLLSANGKDALGKPVPDIMLSLDRYVQKSQQIMSVISNDKIIYGGLELTIGQDNYRVYIRRIFSYLSGDYMASFFQEFAYSILTATFLISFPLSFLLAWLVVAPIKRLQQATRDISINIQDRKNLNSLLARKDEFAELAKDFQTMTEEIEQQLFARTRLISDVSHELRSPLTRMKIAIAIADNKLNKDGQNSELQRIKLEADRMNLMLSELLDFTKLDDLHRNQAIENIDLKRFAGIVINDAQFEAEQVGVQITSSFPEGLCIEGNKVELLSCLENIVRNAIRYAKSSIHFSCDKAKQGDLILLRICDDGKGVPEEDVDKIFSAFYRPDLARSRQSGGVGLGLAIAQKAIAVHSGKIRAENIKTNGKTTGFAIHIELPIKQ